MNNKFHAISMCTLIAAFATNSALAASVAESGCSEALGFKSEGGVCYYDIQEGEQTPTIPSDLKSFKVRYNGLYDISKATVNLDNPDGTHYTYSVTGTANLENGGDLTIKNRLNLNLYVSMLKPATQNAMASYSSENCKSCKIEKETGFNAVAVEFTGGIAKNGQSFELTVTEELFDFTSLEIYHTKAVDPDQVNMMATMAQYAVLNNVITQEQLDEIPIDKIKMAVAAGYKSVALLHGKSEYGLTTIPSNIDVDYVYLDRKFTVNGSGLYSTLTLPFSISKASIANVSNVYAFKNVEGNKAHFTSVNTLEAYTPYLIELVDGATGIEFSEGVTLASSEDVSTDVRDGQWVFRGTLNYNKWVEGDPQLTGCGENKDKSCAYGYAASGKNMGKFVRVGEGAYIYPFRAYLFYDKIQPLAPANASYVLRPTVDIPDELELVLDGKDGQTTSIGRFDTRTGEIHINNMKHTYDLKGRRVNGTNNARGAYYGKKVLMK